MRAIPLLAFPPPGGYLPTVPLAIDLERAEEPKYGAQVTSFPSFRSGCFGRIPGTVCRSARIHPRS